MKVIDLCIREVSACTRDTSLARAGALMRRQDVGSLPVVDRQGHVVGMLTDRDIALELTRRDEPAYEVYVDEVMCERPATCGSGDDLRDVLRLMADSEVRRLPVVDERGRLEGILSIDDIVCQAAAEGDSRRLPHGEVIDAFCRITRSYLPQSYSAPRSRKPRGYYRRESPRFEPEGNGGSRRERPSRA